MNVSGLVVAQDIGTAACGLLNAGYFGAYWWRRKASAGRRVGAAALALVSLAAVVEAAFSQTLFWAQRGVVPAGGLSDEAWTLVRLPLFVATAFVALLVVRRLR